MIALVVGHNYKSKGAYNAYKNTYEYELNFFEAEYVSEILDERGIENQIILRDEYKDLPDKVNKLNPNLIISFHHNAYNGKASGTETLYYHKSRKGKTLANIMQYNITNVLKLPNRGSKPRSSEDRGGYLLRYTNAPCIILEPCFMDNDIELEYFINNQAKYCEAVVKSIIYYFEGLGIKP